MSERPADSATEEHYDRRSVILGAGAAVAGIAATVAASAPATAQAESTKGQECMTILYPNGANVHFDFDYYERTHIHNIMNAYGKSISRFELRRGQPGADGAPAPYISTITIWIADPKAFDDAAAKHQAALRADVPKFTNAMLVAQRDKIVAIAT
jgi:uncharacterized protein (TIGR02118 family)